MAAACAVVSPKVKHIDRAQKIIRVEQSNGRTVMLSPETFDLLRQWWKVRASRDDATTPLQERCPRSGAGQDRGVKCSI
jgi:hypothetical protein